MDGEDADKGGEGRYVGVILTPDQRVRVFVSSTMEELAAERTAVRDAVDGMHLSPVLFELGARAHPPRSLYRSYLEQSHVFVGIYWERYGWIAPTMEVSGLEDEYLLADAKPKLMYVKRPAPGREPRLEDLLDRIRSDDAVAYKQFDDAAELAKLVADDLSLLLSEAFLDVEPTREAPATARRFTLPGEATRFIGRAAEVEHLRPMFDSPDVRMVTPTGPGGIGKTRLALRVAAQAAVGFEEGAAFVSLESIEDDALVVDAIARAVGLRDATGVTVETLADDLASRSLLLVLDNFEHVMGAADVVAELLRNAPRLKVLATSREALRLQAEHEYPVPPLADADGVRMFVDRALAIRPDLQLDEHAGGTIDRIGQRLDGVPLAIELAAARVKLLSPEALLDRLDRRLEFLVGGPRDLPERQRALRSTIEWSFDLLEDADRALFERLGVFVGSFGLGAAEAVLGPGTDAIDALASLVDKSLLRVEPTSGEPRFRMLSMIAEFARDRLAQTDDAELVGSLHAAHYRDVALAVGEGVVGRDQQHWLAVLGDDHDGEAGNVRAALAWLLAHGRLDDVAEMAWALWVPAWMNGRIDEGRRMAQAALDVDGEMTDRSRARLETVLGMFLMWGGGHVGAAAALRRGRELAERIGDDDAAASATLGASMIVGPSEGEDRAEQLARETLDRFTRLGDVWGEAAALNILGWLYVAQDRFDDADVFERTLSTSLAAGDEQSAALAEVNLAEYALHHGDVDRAAELLDSGAERHRTVRLPYSIAYLLDGAARLAARTGESDRAARLLGAASQLRSSAGVSVWGSQLARRDRFVEEVRTVLGDRAYAEAVAAGSLLCYSDALAEVPTSG